jgi:hypothetical protein
VRAAGYVDSQEFKMMVLALARAACLLIARAFATRLF